MAGSDASDQLSDEELKKKLSESGWPIRYGSAIMAVSGIITGNIFNYHYRTICRMGKAFRLTTLIPSAIVCPLFGGLLHAREVNKLLKRKEMKFECPICYELRSGLTQFVAGGLYPLLTAYYFCIGFTKKHQPGNLKKIGMFDTTSKVAQFKMVLPMTTALTLLMCNFLVGSVVAQLELRSLIDKMKEDRVKEYKNCVNNIK